MNNNYIWHYTDEEYMKLVNEQLKSFYSHFNYKDYITPYNESRELVGRIIEEFQPLEHSIKSLLQIALEKKLYTRKNFNFDNYIQASKIINELSESLIDKKTAKLLIEIIKFRNYIIHEHFISTDREKAEKAFPHFLFLVFEAEDYINNMINRISGKNESIRNIFDGNL